MFNRIFAFTVRCITVCSLMAFLAFFGLKLAGFTPYIVLSSSMEPVLSKGSLAFVDTRKREVKVGDVITYTLTESRSRDSPEKTVTVTHRVVRITEDDALITKGDANEAEDLSPVDKDRVVGKLFFSVPRAGALFEQSARKLWICFSVCLLLLNTAVLLSSREVKIQEKSIEEKEKT